MQWVIAGVVVAALAAGMLFGINRVGGATLESPAQQAEPTAGSRDRTTARADQRLANAAFEVVPGEIIGPSTARDTSAGRGGDAYDVLFRLHNLGETTSLKVAFLDLTVQGFDAAGNPVEGRVVERHGEEGGIAPGSSWKIYTTVIVDPAATSWELTITYAEPNVTVMTASFVWPLGR